MVRPFARWLWSLASYFNQWFIFIINFTSSYSSASSSFSIYPGLWTGTHRQCPIVVILITCRHTFLENVRIVINHQLDLLKIIMITCFTFQSMIFVFIINFSSSYSSTSSSFSIYPGLWTETYRQGPILQDVNPYYL